MIHYKRAPWPTRFWMKVRVGCGCWAWLGGKTTDGYGVLNVDGVANRAHRLSWRLHFGEIPSGMLVCHTCDNPACVNPGHLFIGTDADNNADKSRKGRYVSGRAKLTREQIAEVRADYAAGESMTCLARRFGVTPASVYYHVVKTAGTICAADVVDGRD